MHRFQINKEEGFVAAMQDYTRTFIEYVENPAIADNDLSNINDKVVEFFKLINEASLRELDKSELLQLNSVIGKFHKALKKRSNKSNVKVLMVDTTAMRKQETQADATVAVTKSAERAESAWKSLIRAEGKAVKMSEEQKMKILSLKEFNDFREEEGFISGHRGTFKTKNEDKFLYVKRGLQAETKEQVENDLAVVEFLTKKGIFSPDTKWGVYLNEENKYQVFATMPKLVECGWALYTGKIPKITNLQHILTRKEVSADVGHEITETEWYSAILKRDDSHVLEWFRRIDPEFDPVKGPKNRLAEILNFAEASHSDNWGWDKNGKLYPIDIEVVRLNSANYGLSGKYEGIINEWCKENRKGSYAS